MQTLFWHVLHILVVQQGFKLVAEAVVVDDTGHDQVLVSLGDRQLLLPVANVSVLAQPKGNNGAYDRIPIPVGFSVHSFGRFDKGIKGAAVAA